MIGTTSHAARVRAAAVRRTKPKTRKWGGGGGAAVVVVVVGGEGGERREDGCGVADGGAKVAVRADGEDVEGGGGGGRGGGHDCLDYLRFGSG